MKNLLLILLLLPIFCNAQNTWFNSYPQGQVQQVAPTIYITFTNPSYESIFVAYTTTLGNPAATEAGFCWNTTGNPTIEDSHQPESIYEGADHIYNLTHNTTYYIKAFIISPMGIYYSNEAIRKTLDATPIVQTAEIPTSIGTTTAECSGAVTDNKGYTITEMGICWNHTDPNPTIYNDRAAKYIGTEEAFISQLTGLTQNTSYYYRAYAINSSGIVGYGVVRTLTTNASCVLATLTTNSVSNITSTTALSGGNISSDGGCSITARGICWSTSTNPTIANSKTNDGTGTGSFTSSITGLNAGTTYYVRAYATNSTGTSYGNEITFTTLTLPTVTTTAATSVTQTSAASGGNVTADGGATVSARGVCWSTSTNPTTANSKTSDGTGAGSFTSSITGLTANTKYYVRAYATNSVGTAYGNEITFTTDVHQVAPTITITSATASYTSIYVGYSTTLGTPTATEAGFCWNTTGNPTVNDSHQPEPTSSGADYIYGLTHNTTYYIRAFIISSMGTYYSNEVSRTTLNGLPVVSTAELPSSIGTTTAECGGEVNSSGGSSVTDMGICWSSSNSNPTISDSHASKYVGNEQGFVTALTGLTPSTLYYFRAYATNSFGSGYGSAFTFTTNSSGCVLATLTTNSISNITSNSASSGGNITSDGGCSVTERGVCWNTSGNPTVSDSHTTDGSGTGSFTSSLTGLTCGTLYYVRAYATNSVGTAYGNQVSFATEICTYTPNVTINTVSKYGDTYATFSGSVTNDGNSMVTERGFVYSTTPNPNVLDNKIISGSGVGLFTSNAYGLNQGTTYYVRAYAINNVGTSYSNEVNFTTFEAQHIVSISTSVPINITTSTATLGGNISSDGGNVITERGVVYGTSINPTTSNTKIQSGSGIGIYSVSVTGLNQGTTYYVRAYAINSSGTSYGLNELFITSIDGATACDAEKSFPGGESYPSSNTITLGSGIGNVSLTFNAFSIPDLFLVEYNSIIYSSGWRGNSSYDYGGQLRSSFRDALRGKSDPTQPQSLPTSFPNAILYPDDGYPRVLSGTGGINFTKSTNNPTTATVRVYAPMTGTKWNYILSCPN